jgi:hypothetical protein
LRASQSETILNFKFYRLILKTDYFLLVIALFFFAISVALDLFPYSGIDPYFYEDGAKLVGIVSWLVYFFNTAEYSIRIDENHF